jgi:hypothetical protein
MLIDIPGQGHFGSPFCGFSGENWGTLFQKTERRMGEDRTARLAGAAPPGTPTPYLFICHASQ